MGFVENIRQKAAQVKMNVIFPEATEARVLQAVQFLFQNKLANPILIGSQPEIAQIATQHGIDITNIQIRDPVEDASFKKYVTKFTELRKEKGMTEAEATKIIADPIFFGTMMIYFGEADGLVSGSTHSTANTIRPALQIIKTKQGVKLASSFFFMVFPDDRTYFFSDCGININPNEEELAHIGKETILSAREFGFEPKVAMLSFSTKGSAKDELADKVIKATEILKTKLDPRCHVDGELQADVALVPAVAQSKAPGGDIQGDANVLIFPDLNAGNISYKLVQRLGGAQAIGPIMQGLARPINDLSRGCNVEDIINVACITAIQAVSAKKNKLTTSTTKTEEKKTSSTQNETAPKKSDSHEDVLSKLKLLAVKSEPDPNGLISVSKDPEKKPGEQ